jgi:hypothetical protein
MEHQHEPGSIGDLMLKAAEHCANKQRAKAAQLHKDAATDKARGDLFYAAGEWDRAAGAHGQAMKREAVAKACEDAAADLVEAFKLEALDEAETVHLGVGEGYEGLPPERPHQEPAENLPTELDRLSREQLLQVTNGILRVTGCLLERPLDGEWLWTLTSDEGTLRRLPDGATVADAQREAAILRAAESAASSKLETTDLNPH